MIAKTYQLQTFLPYPFRFFNRDLGSARGGVYIYLINATPAARLFHQRVVCALLYFFLRSRHGFFLDV